LAYDKTGQPVAHIFMRKRACLHVVRDVEAFAFAGKGDILVLADIGIVIPRERPAAETQNVANIIEALRASIAQDQTTSARPKQAASASMDRARCCFPSRGARQRTAL
jgi:hypothetical protein